jgi:hypothetical protein
MCTASATLDGRPVVGGPATPYVLVSSGPVLDGPSALWDIQHDRWRIERPQSPSP